MEAPNNAPTCQNIACELAVQTLGARAEKRRPALEQDIGRTDNTCRRLNCTRTCARNHCLGNWLAQRGRRV
eukprot:7495897-Lingulodinium_polyedra.AAC.1